MLECLFIFSLDAGSSLSSSETKELHLLGVTDLYSAVNAWPCSNSLIHRHRPLPDERFFASCRSPWQRGEFSPGEWLIRKDVGCKDENASRGAALAAYGHTRSFHEMDFKGNAIRGAYSHYPALKQAKKWATIRPHAGEQCILALSFIWVRSRDWALEQWNLTFGPGHRVGKLCPSPITTSHPCPSSPCTILANVPP